jgi:hypothetical protein
MDGAIDIERADGIIRVFLPGSSREACDPYEWACAFRWIGPHAMEIMGVTKPPSIAAMRILTREARRRRLRVTWQRHNLAQKRTRGFDFQ